MTTTWTIFSAPSGNLPARVESGTRADRCRHQEFVALVDHSLRILGVDVRMPARDAMFAADPSDGSHRLDDGGVIVVARVAEVLREVAFTDQHDADARHVVKDAREVVYRAHVLAHDDHENLAVGDE